MSHEWFRLHNDFINDPKMRRYFSKSERLDWVNLLCLSSKSKQRGTIALPDDEIAYALDLEDDEWLALKGKFIDRRMVEIRADGVLVILNWTERQYDKPSDSPEATAERKRKSRATAQEEQPVTPSHAESRAISRGRDRGYTETETEAEAVVDTQGCREAQEPPPAPPLGKASDVETILAQADSHPDRAHWRSALVAKMAEKGWTVARKPAYALTVLKGWLAGDGTPPVPGSESPPVQPPRFAPRMTLHQQHAAEAQAAIRRNGKARREALAAQFAAEDEAAGRGLVVMEGFAA